MDSSINWNSIPGIVAAGVLTLYSMYVLSSPITAGRTITHFFRQEALGPHLWSPLFVLLAALCVAYTVTTEHRLSRRTLAAVVGTITVAELRYGVDQYRKTVFLPLMGLILVSILAAEVTDSDATDPTDSVVQFDFHRTFTTAALTACGLLVAGVAVTVLSVLFVETSPIVAEAYDSTPAAAFLTGTERAHDETRIPFWGVAVAVAFLAVVTDAVRHRAIRRLTVIALVVNTGALTVFWYPSLWNVTVAAVGALLTVITLALVLDERTETTLS